MNNLTEDQSFCLDILRDAIQSQPDGIILITRDANGGGLSWAGMSGEELTLELMMATRRVTDSIIERSNAAKAAAKTATVH